MAWVPVYKFASGAASQGTPGPRGTQWLAGVESPKAALGAEGDFYFQQSTGAVWRKAAAYALAIPAWTIIATLQLKTG